MSPSLAVDGVVGAVALAPSVAAALILRRRRAPDLRGAEGWLADVTVALAAVLLVAHLTGAVGLFRLLPLFVVGLLCSMAALRAPARPAGLPPVEGGTDRSRQPALAAFVVAAVVVGAQWGTRIASAYRDGIGDYDSLHYHLPFAARFVQLHRLGELHQVNATGVPTVFHPADSEVLHAVGMLWFGDDIASPLLNAGWAAFGVLAAWCIGRPTRTEPLSALAFLVVLSLPITALSAGSALSDVPSYACLLAAIAFLVGSGAAPGSDRVTLAAIAAGMAIGMKLPLLAPLGVLTLGLAWLWRDRWRTWLGAWCIPLAVTGGFWYVRNLVATGSPVPSLEVPGLPHAQFDSVDRIGFSVASYWDRSEVIREWFLPGAAVGVNRAWPLLLLAVIVVTGVLLAAPKRPYDRVLGVVLGCTALAYLVTPTSAGGPLDQPQVFALNIRYAFPALAVALVLLPGLVVDRAAAGRRPAVVVAVVAGLSIVMAASFVGSPPRWPGLAPEVPAWAHGERLGAGLGGLVVLAVAALLVVRRPRAALIGGLALALLAGALFADDARRARYARSPVAQLATSVAPASIGIAGFDRQYSLYGAHLDNRVQYVGERLPHGGFAEVASCEQWRDQVARDDYDLVVVADPGFPEAPDPAWSIQWPAAEVLLRNAGFVVLEIEPDDRDDTSCDG